MDDKRQALRKLVEARCLMFGDFTLSTGEKSKFYFDCKLATLDGKILALIADAFLEEISRFAEVPTAIGGLTMGADSISAAVAMRAAQMGAKPDQASIVRKEPKKHGTRNYIENQLPPGSSIVVVDDVITSGTSTQKACDRFSDVGYRIVGILALVDREAGGLERLALKNECEARAIFKTRDFPKMAETPLNVDRPRAIGAA